ncbi:uncharacterized protein A4U43_C03F1830 [Asparagus officinalis]|uniref:CRAL-TRIO domain-containing protein n=1 Tax=Asparagus officinalis TaxID=4686 RepID=A0A5P1F9B2_ASPOF|nr:random slug protein 5-like [Asparagus officinalis]XP_020255673.1 random slug protein 5-like [Asparagus officinalis]ONK74007.1 uncharacterized protein A4U43_C03F1830 [Asparagus officinalis]
MSLKNFGSFGSGRKSIVQEEAQESNKIQEVRALLGPLPEKLSLYCSDECIRRYLTARGWNVRRATKMLKATLKWRLEYKPEEIRWEEIANEAQTGKIYRSSLFDKYGRSVLVMRPGFQNTNAIEGQVKYLVYCMENAIFNLPAGQEQMVWLISFCGFAMSHMSVRMTKETANVLQDRYPETLGAAILYDPPKIFESFWMVVKPFLEPKTHRKVKFVYSVDPSSRKIMEELFNLDELETSFGGRNQASSFNFLEYDARMTEDDKKMALFWAGANASETVPMPSLSLSLDVESDSDESFREEQDKFSPSPMRSATDSVDKLT